MSPSKRIALLAALSSSPVIAAPFLAIGDNAELYLTASTEARYEDNVALAPDALKQDDLIYEFTPGFELVYGKKGKFKSTLDVFEQIVRYTDLNSLDNDLFNVIWAANYKGAKLTVDADASFRQLNQNTRALAGAIFVRRDTTAGKVKAEYAFTAKTKADVGVQYDETSYKNPAFIDSNSYTIPVNYYYGISSKVDLSAGVRYRQTQVDVVRSDSKDLNYNVGARGEFTAKLTGSFNVGYTIRSYDAASDDGLVAVNAGLNYELTPKTKLSLDMSKDFDTSAFGTSQEMTHIIFGAQTQFSQSLSGRASLEYERINFAGPREDDYYAAAIGFDYAINQHISLSTAYNYEENSSNVAAGEFTANIISISANFRY
jgi:polysaccharide biosynthesis protein VpsM